MYAASVLVTEYPGQKSTSLSSHVLWSKASNIFGETSNENVTWNVRDDGIVIFTGTADRKTVFDVK
jgi:hypothetical protein